MKEKTISQIKPVANGSAHPLGRWTEELYLQMIVSFSSEQFQVDSNQKEYCERTLVAH